MDENDPITQFFPGEEDVDLYNVLSLERDATLDAVKKAYRRLALIYHPDKHATSTDQIREDASTKFQQIGFAYAVLSDSKRKARYDSTGKTDEGLDLEPGEGGWDAYFEDLFDRVTRGKLDEMKKEYQGSTEEIEDLKTAYHNTNGSLGELMSFVPHSTHDDESRFIIIISDLIKKGQLSATPTWLSSSKDEKAKLGRKKQGEKEAKEAEMAAKELGVWDEFYGSGKKTERKEKGKRKDDTEATADEDHSALQALIMRKKQKNMDVFFDSLAAKYSEPTPKDNSRSKGKKRVNDTAEDKSSKKKSRSNVPPAPEIDDEEFAKLQEKLFGDKVTPSAPEGRKGKGKRAK
ncbi:DnaJ-domain-containing protein [Phlegmacium glaucopus]|nr:DnaJ-domain-containing protein [Phlegmacium glaucopus]